MASLKFFILAAIIAFAYAEQQEHEQPEQQQQQQQQEQQTQHTNEEQRVKKDVLLGTIPYAYSALPYAYAAYDDGKYYPGKYEKTVVAAAPAVTAYHAAPAVIPAVSTYSAAAAVPVSTYTYPYTIGAYPYYKSIVY